MSKLRTFRKSRGLSQEQLARAVGVEKATISRLETGRRSPSFGLIIRICELAEGELSPNDFVNIDQHLPQQAAQ